MPVMIRCTQRETAFAQTHDRPKIGLPVRFSVTPHSRPIDPRSGSMRGVWPLDRSSRSGFRIEWASLGGVRGGEGGQLSSSTRLRPAALAS